MNGLAFLENINNVIDDDLIVEADLWVRHKARIPKIFIITISACLCIIVGLIFVISYRPAIPMTSPPADISNLPGSDIIYPTVMVNGGLYEWRQGNAEIDTLPVGSVYYGKINHSDNSTPKNDCEFVSVFTANGEVFVDQTIDLVYIIITTDWLDNKIVVFEPVIRG